MKQIFDTVVFATQIMIIMALVFLVAFALAAWYECFVPFCDWRESAKDCVLWFTAGSGILSIVFCFMYRGLK